MGNSSTSGLTLQAKKIREGYPRLAAKVGKAVPEKALAAAIAEVEAATAAVDKHNLERKPLVIRKAEAHQHLSALLKQLRYSVKADFGDDSAEYAMVGGKRRSERKRPTRTAHTPKITLQKAA